MRRSTGDRHPILEGIVFGLALLLFLVLAYQGVKRVIPLLRRPKDAGAAVDDSDVPVSRDLPTEGTERAVTYVAPVQMAPGGNPQPKAPAIPSPKK